MTENTVDRSQDLHKAFNFFSEISDRLTKSYRELEERVAVLTQELASARNERLLQLAEKERLANRLQHLLDALPGAIIVLDGNDVIQEYNPAAVELLGEPLLDEKWADVAHKAITDLNSDGYYATLADGRQVGISSRALGTEAGRILLLKDDTETRRLQEMLNRHRRLSAMGEMVARLAHQIRTPLTSVMLYASQLSKQQCDAASQAPYADKILLGLRQLERMVNDMLAFARGGEFTPEKVSINALLGELKQIIEPQLKQCGGQLRVVNGFCDATIEGCHDMLLGALLNLATNAIQACGKGADLLVETASSASNRMEIRVVDNGPGIDEKIQGKIFEPFFTTRSGGTGLGLAVVRAVIQGHQGNIRHESTPGHGAAFIMDLPCVQGEIALASGTRDDTQAHGHASRNEVSQMAAY